MVSIVVPSFNQGKFLSSCLGSVFTQSYKEWECIIVDDGSTDETESIAKSWLLKDSRFKYIYQINKGLPAARNAGIKEAKGTFILPLDADDQIAVNYVELGVKEFQLDSNLILLYCEAEKFGIEKGRLDLKPFSLYELALNNMIFCSAIFKKEHWQAIGGYDETLKNGWEDWELWISLLKNGGKVKKLSYTGFFYRIKSSSLLKSMDSVQEHRILNYLSCKHSDFFTEQFGSFTNLKKRVIELELENKNMKFKQNNKRFVIDLFFKKIFGFQLFGTFKE